MPIAQRPIVSVSVQFVLTYSPYRHQCHLIRWPIFKTTQMSIINKRNDQLTEELHVIVEQYLY